jgi:hypothetical protein
MQYGVRAELIKQVADGRFVTDISFDESIASVAAHDPERVEIAGVG